MFTWALLLTGMACTVPSLPRLQAVSTPDGVLLWVESNRNGLNLEYKAAGLDWTTSEGLSIAYDGGQAWWLEGASPGHRFRIRKNEQVGIGIHPAPIELRMQHTSAHDVVFNDEWLAASVSAMVPEGPGLYLTVEMDGESVDVDCLNTAALAEPCLGEGSPMPLEPGVFVQRVEWRAQSDTPRHQRIRVGLWADDVMLHDVEETVRLTGRWLYWGDLHAHSNLSHDGCEDADEDCVSREDIAGADFFDNADQNALDFVAITEHAEFLYVLPPGEDDPKAAISIWDEQQGWARDADGVSTVLPVMGYEWTHALAGDSGGHKTVLLEELESCDARRIRSFSSEEEVNHPSGALFYSLNPVVALEAAKLWSLLDKAAAECDVGRALTFAHHPAWLPPEWVDWTDPANAPDPLFEPVVEIHSEHASSECADLTVNGCDWGVSTNREHQPNGAVQTALAQGYHLGFVGGTDSHNARPGSLDDGPSCTGRLVDKDGDDRAESLGCHQQDGALTGVYAASDVLSRSALFDSLFARETVVTSGPRLPLRGLLEASDGELYLPGAEVPAGTATVWLGMAPQEMGDWELMEVEVVLPDGSAAAWSDTLPASLPLSLSDEAAYVRVRLWDPLDEVEQRLWLSPWFFGAADR